MDSIVDNDTIRNNHRNIRMGIRSHRRSTLFSCCVVAAAITLLACDGTPPAPVATWTPWNSSGSSQCLGYITLSSAIVIATKGADIPVQIVAGIGWNGIVDAAGLSYDDCLWTANMIEQPFAMTLSCDGGVHTYFEYFTTYRDALNYMSNTRCFSSLGSDGNGSGGGGGGGGGGW